MSVTISHLVTWNSCCQYNNTNMPDTCELFHRPGSGYPKQAATNGRFPAMAQRSVYGRQGEAANGCFGASQLAEPGLADWQLSGNRYGRFGHAALSGAIKFKAGLQPLNFGAW